MAKRKPVKKNLLDQPRRTKLPGRNSIHPLRGRRQLISLSEEEISRREQGWNDRFTVNPPPKCNKTQALAPSPTPSSSSTPQVKGCPTRNEWAQQNHRGGKWNCESKKPTSGKLIPLESLLKPSAKAKLPTKEEKLRFYALKAIDTRETLLYHLNALILCTPVVESPRLPSKPTDPPMINNANRQQMRSRGKMALASTPLNRLSGNGEVVTNAREATKLAQQLATDLQLSGIQCVEAVVEWMLEAGAQLATPPPFLWRGRNYFLKMFTDLDFAEVELQARGINLNCFRQHNPLLMKPKQKLGRALAAHSIIMEMVEFAKDLTPMELLAFSGRMRDSDNKETERVILNDKDRTSLGFGKDGKNCLAGHSMTTEEKTSQERELENDDYKSAVDLVSLLDESVELSDGLASREGDLSQSQCSESQLKCKDDDNELGRCISGVKSSGSDTTEEEPATKSGAMHIANAIFNEEASDRKNDMCGNEIGNAVGKTCDSGHDFDGMSAVQSILEPSVDNTELLDQEGSTVKAATDEVVPKTTPDTLGFMNKVGSGVEQPLLRSSLTHNQSEQDKDNNVDANDLKEENTMLKAVACVQDSQDGLVETVKSSALTDCQSTCQVNDMSVTLGNVPGKLRVLQEKHSLDLKTVLDNPPKISKLLENELKRWTFLEDENRPAQVNAQGCLTWQSARTLKESLRRHLSISECMEGSIISMLDQYGLTNPERPLINLLCSEVAKELNLASHLVQECHLVLDDICTVFADALLSSLALKTSLVSEIELNEVIAVAEAVRNEFHYSTWKYVKVTTTLLTFLCTTNNSTICSLTGQSPVSATLSQLVKVFYPYLINVPREKLCISWLSVSKVLAVMGLPIDCLHLLLDAMCKTLLLAVDLYSEPKQDENSLSVFPKVTIICDREDILHSSVEYIWRHHFVSNSNSSNISVYPGFKSSFGEKSVHGINVEEGEGKGPLKEWFALVSAQLTSKWKLLSTDKDLAAMESILMTASENTLTIPGASNVICPGFQLEWTTNDGDTMCRVVNKCIGGDVYLLDRAVPSHSFLASQLRILQPKTAVFEYVQESESYWLNENTRDMPETRDILVFVGWFIACAITHFCPIQSRIHPLLFCKLLNPQHCVTLEEIKGFDSQLFQSLSGIVDMKPAAFAELLKFEGADESLSAEAYIRNVLESKFGLTSGTEWQLQSLRCGFNRVISIDQLDRLGITGADLVTSLCGICRDPEADFVIDEVFRMAIDTDLSACRPMMDAFWHTVNSFEPLLKRKFIKFVTGVDTLPLAGTEFLRIEMPFVVNASSDFKKGLHMLPQAHTCENTLELPHYWKALCLNVQHDEKEANVALEEKLALLMNKKLRDAIEYSSGYGLDNASAGDGVLSTLNGDNHLLVKDESYDSMGLPALSDMPQESLLPSNETSRHKLTHDNIDEYNDKSLDLQTVTKSPPSDEAYDDYDDWEEESMA